MPMFDADLVSSDSCVIKITEHDLKNLELQIYPNTKRYSPHLDPITHDDINRASSIGFGLNWLETVKREVGEGPPENPILCSTLPNRDRVFRFI